MEDRTILILAGMFLVLVLFLGSGITGNPINVVSGRTKTNIYTMAEIDAKLRGFATNRGVLDMVSKCEPNNFQTSETDVETCRDKCIIYNLPCLFGLVVNGKGPRRETIYAMW